MSTTALSVGERMRVLSICPVFAGVPSRDLGVLAEMMRTERLGSGETLFECGEPADRAYIVAAGRLGVLIPGQAAQVRELGPGDILGEYGLFSGLVRTATVKATSGTVLVSLDYPRFRAFLLQFPEASLVLLRAAVERLTETERSRRANHADPA